MDERRVLLDVVRDVLAGLRELHSLCPRGSCPWPMMWEEDVVELVDRLQAAGLVAKG